MAKVGRGQTRRDSKRRVLRPGESVRADGKYQYKYHIDGKPHFVYSWKLEPTDKLPKGKKPSLMIEKDAYSLVSEILRPESFYEHRQMCIRDRFPPGRRCSVSASTVRSCRLPWLLYICSPACCGCGRRSRARWNPCPCLLYTSRCV